MSDTEKVNATLVDALGSALRSGDHGLKTVPGLLKQVLREEAWRSFTTQRGEHVQYTRFADFVVALPLKGIGASVDLVRRMVADDPEAADLLDQALQNPAHIKAQVHDVDNVNVRPDGNGRAAALRRLRKDAPELHAEVLAGRLSAHAAMVQAGFRRKTLTVPITDTAATARALRRNLDDNAIAELIAELSTSRKGKTA